MCAWLLTVLAGAAAGGMGWGIRGQYGHETGAMIAGALVSLVLVLRVCPRARLLAAARAAALGTIAIGFGGSMTYGQTVGLTHDEALVGNWAALCWGMLGLALKGGLWIGFAGLFLGVGLGRRRVGWREMTAVMLGMLTLYALGIGLLNRPFDPARRVLPPIYFSDDWRWEPGAALEPRPEVWGGMLLALAGGWGWWGLIRRDPLARNITLWAFLAGAVGFPLGQSLQAYHAWNRAAFREGVWATLDPVMNWWNWMETVFGMTFGAILAIGMLANRRHLAVDADPGTPADDLPPAVAAGLVLVHVGMLVCCEFARVPAVDMIYDHGPVMGLIPLVAVAGGRQWPFFLLLPLTLLPIAGKTLRNLAIENHAIALTTGWVVYLVVPLLLANWLAIRLMRQARDERTDARALAAALAFDTIVYLLLNFAFFRFPWPWHTWTARTPNALCFLLCAAILLAVASAASSSRRGAPP
ncbi:MAG: hypothetical protein ACOYK7_00580 [Pirellulales bacterium]